LIENNRHPSRPGEAITSEEDALRRALDRLGSPQHQLTSRSMAGRTAPLRADIPRPRHRFARDGEVQVEWRSNPEGAHGETSGASTENATALQAQLEAERQAHAVSTAELRDARSRIQQLETRLAHLQMSLEEAERRRAAAAAATAAAAISKSEPGSLPIAPDAPPAVPRVARGRPRKQRPAPPRFPRQKPVRWW
jgi:DNA repair exonuclease SbcCD ATPase subunit